MRKLHFSLVCSLYLVATVCTAADVKFMLSELHSKRIQERILSWCFYSTCMLRCYGKAINAGVGVVMEWWDECLGDDLPKDNSARGQCVISSLVVQDYFGGELFRAQVRGDGFNDNGRTTKTSAIQVICQYSPVKQLSKMSVNLIWWYQFASW